MDKKIRDEIWFMERFLAVCPTFPKGELCKLAPTEEPPDFHFQPEGKQERWGIELTQFHNEPYTNDKFSQKQRYEMEEEIVRRAEQLFMAQLNLPMNVAVWFRKDFKCPKRFWDNVAAEICNTVFEKISDYNLLEDFRFRVEYPLPKYLRIIHGSFHQKYPQSIWYAGGGKAVPDPKPDHILAIIRKKEERFKDYTIQFDQKCLIIVEGMVPYSWFGDFSEIRNIAIETLFDRVYILHITSATTPISELRIKRPK